MKPQGSEGFGGIESRVWGLGFRVSGLGCRVQGVGCRIYDYNRVKDSGLKVWSLGFRTYL